MAAAAAVFAMLQEETTMPKSPSRPNIEETSGLEGPLAEQFAGWSSKEIGIYAINVTVKLAQEVSRLSSTVSLLEERLEHDYTDTKTLELRSLRSRDKWLKALLTAVITAVAIAEVLRWLGVGK